MNRLLIIVFAVAVGFPALAGPHVQTLGLVPGWNPIHLELAPDDPSPAALAGRSEGRIEAIWTYENRHGGERAFEPWEFSPELEVPPARVQNRWHVFDPNHPRASSLRSLRGGRTYAIRVSDGAEPFDLDMSGRPVPFDDAWVPNGYSFRGFPVSRSLARDERPTFADYFAGSEVHLAKGSGVWAMDEAGRMRGPLEFATTRIEPGRAYWIHTDGVSDYKGPVAARKTGGLDFGGTLVELPLDLVNATPKARRVTLRLRDVFAETSPIRVRDAVSGAWVELDETGVELALEPDSSTRVRLAANRRQISQDGFDSEIEIEGGGFGDIVVARIEPGEDTGLWIGEAHLSSVRQLQRDPPQGGQPGVFDPATDVPADFPDPDGKDGAGPASFPIILHIGSPDGVTNRVTVLRQAALMWRVSRQVGQTTVPGRYAIITRRGIADGLLARTEADGSPSFVGGTVTDGRRFSHVKTAPTFHDDVSLLGPGGTLDAPFDGTGTWTADVHIDKLDPLNPYLHRYHPDHGHPTVMDHVGRPAKGGLDIDRYLKVEFSDVDLLGRRVVDEGTGDVSIENRPGYGDRILTATYREVIMTLSYDPVVVQGVIDLRKAVDGIDELNDGLLP